MKYLKRFNESSSDFTNITRECKDILVELSDKDIKYNVYTSMKLLRILFDKNGDWKTVFGEYNTGRPCINGYSHKVYNYKPDWNI